MKIETPIGTLEGKWQPYKIGNDETERFSVDGKVTYKGTPYYIAIGLYWHNDHVSTFLPRSEGGVWDCLWSISTKRGNEAGRDRRQDIGYEIRGPIFHAANADQPGG